MSKLPRHLRYVRMKILLDALEDYIGLWEIVSEARSEDALVTEAHETDPEAKSDVMQIVADVLERGLMAAGFPDESGGFDTVDETPTQTLIRIAKGWDTQRRPPTIGEVIWFDLTEDGLKYAERLQTAEGWKDEQ